MPNSQTDPRIILASESPRRKYLLEQTGLHFSVVPSAFDEGSLAPGDPIDTVTTLAEAKAAEVAKRFPDSWVIGADTIVSINGQILGKPSSENEALQMLQQLSGHTHQVFTGFCICCRSKNRQISDCVSTDVTFKELTKDEIQWYIQTREPFDKAGAYGIQGFAGLFISGIEGDYYTVLGFPLHRFYQQLRREWS